MLSRLALRLQHEHRSGAPAGDVPYALQGRRAKLAAMAWGFRIRFQSRDGTVQGERNAFGLPVRIGRNALNDCQILHGFVSDFHAVIELVNGRLGVRDLQSRNGVQTPTGEAIGRGGPFDLTATGNTFVIGQFVTVHVDMFERPDEVGARFSNTNGAILGNRAVLNSAPNDARAAPNWRPSAPVPGPSGPPPPGPAVGSWPGAQPGLQPNNNYGPPPPAQGPTPLPDGRAVSRSTQHLSMTTEALALVGLRELASSFVPGVPLETTGDVARLLTKLHDSLEVFCKCFIPLREGYAQFVSSMDLNRAVSQRSLSRSVDAMRVQAARDPAELASALLDWRSQNYDAPQVVESILADLMIHHVAVIEGVTRGVAALLQELSPENIEQAERDGGSAAIFGKYKALWKVFQTRHEELMNETRRFEVVFGPDFAATYRKYLEKQRSSA
jgi:type VI secretion system protein ImpI